MKIVGEYSFNNGKQVITQKYSKELVDLQSILTQVNAAQHKTKTSKEKTMQGKMLYSPPSLNKAIRTGFLKAGWNKQRVPCAYPTQYCVQGYQMPQVSKRAFREIDFIKNKFGVEVQFGKYSFMVYDVCAKMPIFHKMGFINAGIEIVPVKELADEMSSGVSYFEQFVWDLEQRGVADIDIPVLILGIAP